HVLRLAAGRERDLQARAVRQRHAPPADREQRAFLLILELDLELGLRRRGRLVLSKRDVRAARRQGERHEARLPSSSHSVTPSSAYRICGLSRMIVSVTSSSTGD